MLRLFTISLLTFFLSGMGDILAQQVQFDAMHETDGAIYLKTVNGIEVPCNANGNVIEAHPIFRMSVEERIQRGLSSAISSNRTNSLLRDNGPTFHLTYLDQVNNTKK
ncbi:MAG: hypothetical protein JKX84_07335, partial [Flavobacteriales bacterium]|nr:hypothetical protein [Flavobacteriales bacterium]